MFLNNISLNRKGHSLHRQCMILITAIVTSLSTILSTILGFSLGVINYRQRLIGSKILFTFSSLGSASG